MNWVCDVAQLIGGEPTLNWPLLLEQAARLNSERVLLLGLLLAHDLLQAPLPLPVWKHIESQRRLRPLAAQISASLFDNTGKAHRVQRSLFHLQMRKRLRHGLPYVGTRLQQHSRAWWRRSR